MYMKEVRISKMTNIKQQLVKYVLTAELISSDVELM